MAWTVRFSDQAQKGLRKLDRTVAQRLLRFLQGRVAVLEDPRSTGEALRGESLNEFWKYRVGDYRVIAKIEDSALCILVVRVGNRRDVYR